MKDENTEFRLDLVHEYGALKVESCEGKYYLALEAPTISGNRREISEDLARQLCEEVPYKYAPQKSIFGD